MRTRLMLVWMLAIGILLVYQPTQAQSGLSDEANELAAGNTQFAFDLYHAITADDTETNLIFSPYSISQALAMVYAGARANTETQMADTLHFTLPQEALHPAFSELQDSFDAIANMDLSDYGEGQRFQLNIANALWGQVDFPVLPDFLSTLDEYYGAGLQTADFRGDPEGARQQINNWVADATEDRITDIAPPGSVDSNTRLALANAIYFNAAWAFPFDEDATEAAPFTLLDETEVTVPMMHVEARFQYGDGDDYRAIVLPYLFNNSADMVILVPDSGEFARFETELDAEIFVDIVRASTTYQVSLYMPRWEVDFSTGLSQTLSDMGMPDAFDTIAADFSGISEEPLFISNVLHKAFISVDERGTEAAAATAIMDAGGGGSPLDFVELTIDRPFIYAIYQRRSGTILFLGRVMNPA